MPAPDKPDTSHAESRERLEHAFRATRYRVLAPQGSIDVRIGDRNRKLDRCVGDRRWCIVTAYNPGARCAPPEANRRAARVLEQRLRALEPDVLLPTVNQDPAGDWPDEPGWLFTFDSERAACDLFTEFGQVAVVTGASDRPAQLRFLIDHGGTGDADPGSTEP